MTSQPPTPSPSLFPLLQLGLGEEEEQTEDRDKLRRIHLLEDNIRSQEEMVMELQDKIDTLDSIEVGGNDDGRHFMEVRGRNIHGNEDGDSG